MNRISIVHRDFEETHYALNFNDYVVTFRNIHAYVVHVSNIRTFDMTEAEEMARLALTEMGHKEEEFETICIERI